jgi:transposase
VRATFGWVLQTLLRPVATKGLVILPERWVAVRTFAWLGRYRRHAKDSERKPETKEPVIDVAMINLMSCRQACKEFR